MQKASDRMKWDYVCRVLEKFDFAEKWIGGCISSPAFAVLINGESTEWFQSMPGLKQGNPL